jgi:hypothetical protein
MTRPSAINDMKKKPRHTHTDWTDRLPSGRRVRQVLLAAFILKVQSLIAQATRAAWAIKSPGRV